MGTSMSTNGMIARPKDGEGFEGRYHHWDSYPEGLGASLFKLANGYFKNDLHRMMQVLVDEHSAWSTIVGDSTGDVADFSLEPGFLPTGSDNKRAQCYCHGDRHEENELITNEDYRKWVGIEWIYIVDPDLRSITVLYPEYEGPLRNLGTYSLSASEPDWEALSKMAYETEKEVGVA